MSDDEKNPEFDVFISHASEDKNDVARPLHDALVARGLSVWLDDLQLVIGDSLRGEIDRALSQSRFGVVVLSPHFFAKKWPGKELDGLTAIEVLRGKTILPVWHKVDHDAVLTYSPTLADKLAATTDQGIEAVADEIMAAVEKAGIAIPAPASDPAVKSVVTKPSVPEDDEDLDELVVGGADGADVKPPRPNGGGGILNRLNKLQGLFGLLAVCGVLAAAVVWYLGVNSSVSTSEWDGIDVVYYKKSADHGRVEDVLRTLPLSSMETKSSGLADATNALWYGSNVDRKQVNELAVKLINSSVSLQYVGPFNKSSTKTSTVEIGTSKARQGLVKLTAAEINAGRFSAETLLVIDEPQSEFGNPLEVAVPVNRQFEVVNEVVEDGVVLPGERKNFCTSNPCPTMMRIPGGEFQMGSRDGEDNEKPVHTVTMQAFELAETEVTFAQFDVFTDETNRERANDKGWGQGNRPVILVSWNEATEYARWLSEKTGRSYRLPTEAEWEYAARAGVTTKYWWGDDAGTGNANCKSCGSEWDDRETAPVKSFKANAFGLYDMTGNVWEWVQDCWHDNYRQTPDDGSAWLEADGGDCQARVVRGGSWLYPPSVMRSAARDRYARDTQYRSVGFRVARTL